VKVAQPDEVKGFEAGAGLAEPQERPVLALNADITR
jgi:hypothetical protein